MNYEEEMHIDNTALDVEWLDQPKLMMRFCKLFAAAEREKDRAEEALNFIKSELDKKIRKNPAKYGLDKVTEPSIAITITAQDQYIEAMKDFLNAKYEANITKGAVRSAEQRKDALENLVRLHGQQYFAGPRIPRELNHEVKQRIAQKEADLKVGPIQRRRIKNDDN